MSLKLTLWMSQKKLLKSKSVCLTCEIVKLDSIVALQDQLIMCTAVYCKLVCSTDGKMA
jgi:hypothetical protein